MTIRRDIHALLNRLAAAEEQFRANEFLAPALPGGVVHVRVAGVLLRLRVSGFVGWGLFRPAGTERARLVRRATRAERRGYLDQLPARRLILCAPLGRAWLAWLAPGKLLPVHLVEDGLRFDAIEARFDGVQHWFDGTPNPGDPAAVYLRESFARATPAARLFHPGLSPEQLDSYTQAEELCRPRATPAAAVPSITAPRGGSDVPVAGVCLGGLDVPGFAGVLRDIPGGTVPPSAG